MKKKKIIALSLLSGVVLAGSIISTDFAINYAEGENKVEFQESYVVGDEILIPDYQIETHTGKVKADKSIICPNGRVFKKDSFTPTEMGEYTVRYSANGVSEDFSFYVALKKFAIEGAGSAEYKASSKTPNKKSLVVDIEAGSKFVCNEVINLNDFNKDKPLISFYPLTDVPGVTNANTMKIRFTDIYDSSKYLQFEIDASRQGYSHGVVYMRVGGDNQTPTGIEKALGRVHSGTIFGFPYNCNWYCCNTDKSSFREADYINNKIVLSFDTRNMIGYSATNSNGEFEICDLDNAAYFSEFWSGFTTGECTTSIWFDNYQAASSSICITKLGNVDLTEAVVEDDIDPTIVVHEEFEELPNAVVNQKYRFYDCDVYDSYCNIEKADIRVYRDYYTSSKIEVAHEGDGFIPTRLGTYYIEYSATDYSGNVSKEIYPVNCTNQKHNFSVVADGTYAKTGFVGSKINVADLKIADAIGEPKVETFWISPNGSEILIDKTFIPLESGKHTIRNVVTDFVGTKETFEYQIDVTLSESPILNDEAQLLPYYISGFDYELPTLTGIDFNTPTKELVNAKISIVEGGKETHLDSNVANFSASSTDQFREIILRYTVSNGMGSAHKDYPVTVVTTTNDNFFHMDRYFDTENMQISADKEKMSFTTNTNGKAVFVNFLSGQSLETNFSFAKFADGVSSIDFYLTDSINKDEVVKISYSKGDLVPQVIVNDDAEFVYNGLGENVDGLQMLAYEAAEKVIMVNKKSSIPVKTFLNGEKFTGFSSGAIYLSFEVNNLLGGDVAISLFDINGQEMSNTKYDYIAPKISLYDDYGGAEEINTVVNLSKARSFDVFDPSSTVYLTVYDENNKVINDVNGVALNKVSCEEINSFLTQNYGKYRVVYTAKDVDDNTANFTYVISVFEKVPPVIKLEGSNKTTAEVGEKINIAKASVSDNVSDSSHISLKIYVITPHGVMTGISNESYTFSEAGHHIIRYVAIDENNNISIVDNVVTVK